MICRDCQSVSACSRLGCRPLETPAATPESSDRAPGAWPAWDCFSAFLADVRTRYLLCLAILVLALTVAGLALR